MKSYVDDILRRAELLARVMNGEVLSKADAAELFSVTEITINRDLKALRDIGISLFSKKGRLEIEENPPTSELISLASNYLPLKLNSDVFHKQVKVYSSADRKDYYPKLILLSKGVEEGLIIELKYKRFYDNRIDEYKLYPVRLINDNLNWKLHAFKAGEDVIKTFYLRRIQKLKITNKKFSKLSLPKEKEKLFEIELQFDPRVRDEILDKIWFESFELEEKEGYIILKTNQPMTNSLAAWCISWWDAIQILKPKELKIYNMIDKVNQDSLFPYNTSKLLNEFSISVATASQFYEDEYLSFDPATNVELNEFEYQELTFVGMLFNSGLSLESVRTLLSKLDRPYYYDISKVYFDFKSKDWKMIPVPEEQKAEDLIERIIEVEDFDRLVDIQDHIQNFLDQNLPE